jgi:hypothetical protein
MIGLLKWFAGWLLSWIRALKSRLSRVGNWVRPRAERAKATQPRLPEWRSAARRSERVESSVGSGEFTSFTERIAAPACARFTTPRKLSPVGATAVFRSAVFS